MVAVYVFLLCAGLTARDASLRRPDAGDSALILIVPSVALSHDRVGSDVDDAALVAITLHIGGAPVVTALTEAARFGPNLPPDVVLSGQLPMRTDSIESGTGLDALLVVRRDHHSIFDALTVIDTGRIRVVLPRVDLFLNSTAGGILAGLRVLHGSAANFEVARASVGRHVHVTADVSLALVEASVLGRILESVLTSARRLHARFEVFTGPHLANVLPGARPLLLCLERLRLRRLLFHTVFRVL